MLTVEDEAFWEGLAPVTFGQLPRLQDQVTVIGYALMCWGSCSMPCHSVSVSCMAEGGAPLRFPSVSQIRSSDGIVLSCMYHTCSIACRFPIGGESISVTSGVVSRIEVTSYVHGAAELLGVQIDAAINSGNSGGPAFNNRGQCVGIAFQSLKVHTLPWHAQAEGGDQ